MSLRPTFLLSEPGQADSGAMGYWVELSGISFAEDKPTWLQAFPYGKYHHPVYGEIEMTPQKAAEMASHVQNKVRGQDLDIDYDHKMHSGEAAGWVRAAQARNDGLWVAVQWTADALTKLKNKAYRYFSPEFSDEWEDPRSKTVYKNVLFGGALTNRPFLKNILPINLSEIFDSLPQANSSKGASVTPEQIAAMRQTLGLPETAGLPEIRTALAQQEGGEGEGGGESGEGGNGGEGSEGGGEGASDAGSGAGDSGESTTTGQPQAIAASEGSAEVVQLRERVAQLEAANRLSEINTRLIGWSNGKHILPVALHEQVRSVMLNAPAKVSADLAAFIDKLLETGTVELGERGKASGGTATGGGSALERYDAAARKLMEADKTLSYIEAAARVSENDPELFEEYRKETFVKEGA